MFGKVMSIPDESHGEVLPAGDSTLSGRRDRRDRARACQASKLASQQGQARAWHANIVAAYYDEAGGRRRRKTQFDRRVQGACRCPRTSTSFEADLAPNDPEGGGVYLAKLHRRCRARTSSAGEGAAPHRRRRRQGRRRGAACEVLQRGPGADRRGRPAGGQAQVRQNKVRRGAAAPVSLVAAHRPTRPSLRMWLTAAIRPAACRLPGSRLPPGRIRARLGRPSSCERGPRPPQKFFENRCKDTRRPIVL